MNKIKDFVENRIEELNHEFNQAYNDNVYYIRISAKIEELEALLDKLNQL
jgi:hypothetical protein